MTVVQILEEIRPVKAMSRETLYVHLRALKIKPLGVQQIPQRYPDNTVEKIRKRLGFTSRITRPNLSRGRGR